MTTVPTDVVVASSASDARAVEAVKQHHAELAGSLAAHVERMLAAAEVGDGPRFEAARRATSAFCTTELVPHAAAEEEALYPAAAAAGELRALVDGMVAEHRVITGLVDELGSVASPLRAAAAGYALHVLFQAHLDKENELVLPAVAADPGTSLASVLDGMHELLGGSAEEGSPQAGDGCGGGCGCGEQDAGTPELDVRTVPHAIRHATVLGAFDAVPAGGSLALVAPHDPLPLLHQLGQRAGGALEVTYTERGPEAWRLLLTRR